MSDDSIVLAVEAEDTRERISATIDELQDRLNPRRIVGDAVESVQSTGTDLVNQGMALLRQHPAAFAAVGLAVGLAALGRNKLGNAKVEFGDDTETYSDYEDDYSPRSSSKASGERFALLRGTAGARVDNSPMIAILVGVAAGALLGSLFPETRRERELFGASSAKLGAAAKAAVNTAREELSTMVDKAAGVTDHAKSAMQSVVGAAKTQLNG